MLIGGIGEDRIQESEFRIQEIRVKSRTDRLANGSGYSIGIIFVNAMERFFNSDS
jgi:hypothetical protein